MAQVSVCVGEGGREGGREGEREELDGAFIYTGSREGSVGVLSEQDEDLDQDTYERLDDFLGGGGDTPLNPPLPPGPKPGTSPNSVPIPAPNYTPPPPPRPKVNENDDDGYTPINITDGEVQVKESPQEEVWATLPLKLSPQPKQRSTSVANVAVDLSPRRTPARSPSAPHVHPLGGSPSGRNFIVPPEPVSPPPSPPVPGRKLTPPTPRTPEKSPERAQPKLPPKKRRELSKLYSDPEASKWQRSPPKVPAPVQVLLLCI